MKKSRLQGIYLFLFFSLLYLPILAVVLYSFNQSPSSAQWTGFTLDWYRELFADRVIFEALVMSLQVGFMAAVLSAILGTYAALVSVFLEQSYEGAIESVMILPLLVPEVALGIALLIFYNFLNLPLGRLTLVLSHSLFTLPYVYVMVRLRLKEIDLRIIEASRDLGASAFQTFYSIILPLIMPAILSASLLSMAMSLDDVVISTYVSGSKPTLPIHVFSMMRVGVSPKINALCSFILLISFSILALSQMGLLVKKKKEVLDSEV